MSLSIKDSEVLVTGGSGSLGSYIRSLRPSFISPSHKEFDITNFDQVFWYIDDLENIPKVILHLAAFISPPLVDADPRKALMTNIIGTANLVRVCMIKSIKLIYVSTDYVFNGEKGGYRETDPVFPVNKYAWSKLGGECAVQMYDNSLIVRTSFSPEIFPYDKAFIDQVTSRDRISSISSKLISLINWNIKGIIHIGGKRQTTYDFAKSLDNKKEIGILKREEMKFRVPRDTSFDLSKYETLREENK